MDTFFVLIWFNVEYPDPARSPPGVAQSLPDGVKPVGRKEVAADFAGELCDADAKATTPAATTTAGTEINNHLLNIRNHLRLDKCDFFSARPAKGHARTDEKP